MAKRFVEIAAITLLTALRDVGSKIEGAGGISQETVHGKEVVFDFYHHGGAPALVRVYTTLTRGADTLRECDSDAMRVVVGCLDEQGKFRPLGKSRKILRTAPNNINPEDRPQVCIDRLIDAVREGYKNIRQVPTCPKCGSPMALRKPTKKSNKNFRPFFGCVSFPACKATKAAYGC